MAAPPGAAAPPSAAKAAQKPAAPNGAASEGVQDPASPPSGGVAAAPLSAVQDPVSAPPAALASEPSTLAPAADAHSVPLPSARLGLVAQDPTSSAADPDQVVPPPPNPVVSAAATPADKPQGDTAQTPEEEEEKLPSGLSLSVGAGMNFGSSTFVPVTDNTRYVRNPMVDWSLSVSPAYMFPDSTRVSASASLSQELTRADGDDDPNTLLFGDIVLGVGRPIYKFENGPRIAGSVSARLPTSTASRQDSLITSIGTGLNAGMPFGKFGLNLSTGFRKNFHRYTHPTRDIRTGPRSLTTRDGLVIEDVVTGIARSGGSELAGNTYFDGENNNTSAILSGTLGLSYSATDRLGFSISYGLSTSWTYEDYPLDSFSSPYATEGRGRHDAQTGTLSGSYRASDKLSFALGMATGGGIFSADNKRFRFPFYAFEGAESNMTTFFVNVTYTESIPL